MGFLNLSQVFTTSSGLYPTIAIGEDHILSISRLRTIVDRESGLKFWIRVPNNFTNEQCRATFDTDVVPTIGYSYCIVCDRDTLFMSSHFQSWATSKGIQLQPSTAYNP